MNFKVGSGLDIINYPQHYEMHKQFLEPIGEYKTEPFLIDEKHAVIPELSVVEKEAKRLFEEKNEKLKLKVCVTGPIELYLKTDFGSYIYEDILNNLAKSVNHFVKNSIMDSRYAETTVIAIDEPSLGFADWGNVDENVLITALDNSVKGVSTDIQIHLHTLKAIAIPMQTEGINIISGEFAASPENMDIVSKKELDACDKFLRAGITRTDIDLILGEYIEKGIEPRPEQLVEDEGIIEARYDKIKDIFGDRIAYAGPDCGLGSWQSQEVAQLLLKRTVSAVKRSEKRH